MIDTTPRAAEQALPCPFCGKKPTVNKVRAGNCQLHGEKLYTYVVSCSDHATFSHPRSREDAIAHWNTRDAAIARALPSAVRSNGRFHAWVVTDETGRSALSVRFSREAALDAAFGSCWRDRWPDGDMAGCRCERVVLPDLSASSAQAGAAGDRPRWRHLKRGSVYEEIGRAELQCSDAFTDPTEGDVIVVYRGMDGKLWAREEREFEDGRFERLSSGAAPAGGLPGVEAIADAWGAERAKYEISLFSGNRPDEVWLKDDAPEATVLYRGFLDDCQRWIDERCAAAIRQRLSAAGMGDAGRDAVAGMSIDNGHMDTSPGAPARSTAADGLREAVPDFVTDEELLNDLAAALTSDNPGRNELRDARAAVISRMKGAGK